MVTRTCMDNEIISYNEMCRRESSSLQQGMHFDLSGRGYSILLMSVRRNSPYEDRLDNDGSTIIYEGHDAPRSALVPDPKVVDQPLVFNGGAPTQNGRFLRAALANKRGEAPPCPVRVYEKIKDGIWSYNGLFSLVDAWPEGQRNRTVFKFKLVAVESESIHTTGRQDRIERRRVIPTAVKLEVWKRDGGRCVLCKATDELHFDHDLPFSKGGTSLKADNVQLLCARHNLSKSDRILLSRLQPFPPPAPNGKIPPERSERTCLPLPVAT